MKVKAQTVSRPPEQAPTLAIGQRRKTCRSSSTPQQDLHGKEVTPLLARLALTRMAFLAILHKKSLILEAV